ncbi:uncharacterized protein [Epargyreus clarus]|uniref:uncharacterized protein n=1 Tax=Epargyreus clarus TaxID=520877 RepID=UPI003C308304
MMKCNQTHIYFQILIVAATLAVAAAQHGYGRGENHAVSSQNVVLHQTHGHVQHVPVIVVHHQPIHYTHSGHDGEHYAPAHYAFQYSVNDPHTGDIKSQHETREGDAVHGSYSLHEADGTVRQVDYTADKHSGFNAIVHRQGHAAHAVPVHHSHH